jgi:uncharacterized damage-inducible protein DinB
MTFYAGRDLARNFRLVRKNTLQIANDIPEAQYGFRPAPGTRSVGELLAHIVASVRWTYTVHAVDKVSHMTFEDFGRYGAENAAFEKTLQTKADIVAALEREGAAFGDWLEKSSDAVLSEIVTFPAGVEPPQKTRFEMLLSAKEHEMHHRAQLMLLQRLVGIVPHLTREREARMAARK